MRIEEDCLVIPDVHTHISIVDVILARHPEIPKRVFLGDIYDDWNDTVEIAIHTATWHRKMLDDPRNVFLLGNHDVAYLGNHQTFKCSGWTERKQMLIRLYAETHKWLDQCWFAVEAHGYVLSHAGIHWDMWTSVANINESCKVALKSNQPIALLQASWLRGGPNRFGGVTWLDWREFASPEGIKQIVGHTPDTCVRYENGSVCLDTHLQHYGILTPQGLEIKEV